MPSASTGGKSPERPVATLVQLPRYRTAVFVSTPVFRFAWWAVLLLHFTAGIFVFCEAGVHLVLSLPTAHANTAALLISVSLQRLAGAAYLLVATLHFVGMVGMLRASIRRGRLRLQFSTRTSTLTTSVHQSHITTQHFLVHSGRSNSTLRSVFHRFQRASANVFGPDGYFGINGPFFTPTLLLRELIEVVMQSYQLWCLSYYVPRSWINRFAVGTAMLNCFSIPLVSLLCTRNEHIRRLMHLTVDMYLDFICAIVVPVLVLRPYILDFNWSTGEFSQQVMRSDVWFADAVAESRYVLVNSYTDFVSSLLPQYSIFNCLRLIKRLLHRQWRISSYPTATAASAVTCHSKLRATRKETRGVWIIGFCVAFWGLTVLGLHIDAERASASRASSGCQLYVRPWLTTKVACSVLRVNYYRRNIAGLPNESSAALASLEESVLTKVVFMHCPALTIPLGIVHFGSLGSIEVFNSTLVEWPANAAIKQSTHPMMVSIFVSYSNLTTVPEGLLNRELPGSLLTIGFINSSISSLPEDLGDLWATSKLARVGFDGTRIRSLPVSFGKMRLRKLWLSENPIETLPEGVFNNSRFTSIRLSRMPLTLLPDAMGDTSALKELVVEHTNVSSLPAWATAWLDSHMDESTQVKKSFFGSTICDSLLVDKWHICEQDLQISYGVPQYNEGIERYPL